MIRKATIKDSASIAEIYNHYILNTPVTFEETIVSPDDISERITSVLNAGLPWLVAEIKGEITGYAYAGRWKERSAYRYSVETSVYLSQTATGKGLGTELYQALFSALQTKGIHIAIGGITLPNPESIALHEKFGMKKVAHFEKVGFKFNKWLDVGYWQVDLNGAATENPYSPFNFKDLASVDDISIQVLIKSLKRTDIATALKETSPEVEQKFFSNMSQNAAEIIREEMDYMGPIRKTEVKEAQENIVRTIHELEQKGELII